MSSIASTAIAGLLVKPAQNALGDFTWRSLPYALALFVLIVALASFLGGTTWLRYFAELWFAYCTAYGVLLIGRRIGGADATYGLIAVLLIVAALVGAAAAYIVSTLVTRAEYRPIAEPFFEAGIAGLLSILTLGWQVATNIKQQQKERVASDSRRRLQLEREVLQSQLKVLQAQIEPHFLYNTLATVRALVSERPTDARRMLWDLIQYLRQALPSMREGMSNVAREVELARAYLSIHEMRMAGRLRVGVEFDPDIGAVEFPPTIVGTLVENAIKHGVEPSKEPCEVIVTARHLHRALVIEVSDTGVGFEPDHASQGVGLDNARARLQLLYGARAELELLPNTPRGVIARVTVSD